MAGESWADEAVEVLDSLEVLAPLVELVREEPPTADGSLWCEGCACNEATVSG